MSGVGGMSDEEMLRIALSLPPPPLSSLCGAAGCRKVGSLRCASCMVVFYCDPKCQKKAWPSHKESCKETAATNKKIADDAAAEEVATKEKKAAADIQTLCAAGCGEIAIERCSRCGGARYCSRICQKKEWPEHKGVCEHAYKVIVMVGESIEVIDTKVGRFRTLAEEGEKGAQCSLGMCFLLGMGISRDKQEAIKWLQRSAEAGCCEAMFCLGTSYFFGNYGIMANKKEALKWHKRAADAGFKPSIEALTEIAVLQTFD